MAIEVALLEGKGFDDRETIGVGELANPTELGNPLLVNVFVLVFVMAKLVPVERKKSELMFAAAM